MSDADTLSSVVPEKYSGKTYIMGLSQVRTTPGNAMSSRNRIDKKSFRNYR